MRRNMRTAVLITGLLLLVAANLFMMYVTPFGMLSAEGFLDASGNVLRADASGNILSKDKVARMAMGRREGFQMAEAGGARDLYQPMGAFDGVKLSTGNSSRWRYTSPNEPLRGPAFNPGADDLFIFKNNQCKPECCGSSFSCGGGCVCTTPSQRDYINQRGGNRTAPEDGV